MKKLWGKYSSALGFTIAFALLLIHSCRLNFDNGAEKNRGVFYSDRSIYYVYLPATFIYNWDANRFPARCDTLYKGFILDTVSGKVINKMTYGVALFHLPFFLSAHAIAKTAGLEADGFSPVYRFAVLIAPVLFLLLGLLCLKRFLSFYFSPTAARITTLLVFAGTNLFHYALIEGLMSHVYSFFLFALFLLILKKNIIRGDPSPVGWFGLCLVFALITLIRPVNLLFGLTFFMLDIQSWKDLRVRVMILMRPSRIAILAVTMLLVFLPQMIYWHYLSGSFFHYSYGKEGFTNLLRPAILPVLFSTLNGWLIYTPLAILMIIGAIMMAFGRQKNGLLQLVMIFLITYMFGSWHMWYFGGSAGARVYVEYYTLLAMGLAWLLQFTFRKRYWYVIPLLTLAILLSTLFNLRLMHQYVWNTGSVWAWDDLRIRLHQLDLLFHEHKSYTFRNDFENAAVNDLITTSDLFHRSMYRSGVTDTRFDTCILYGNRLALIMKKPVGEVELSLWLSPFQGKALPEVTMLVVGEDDHIWLSHKMKEGSSGPREDPWVCFSDHLTLPAWMSDPEFRFVVMLTGTKGNTAFVDDLTLRFR